MGRDVFTELWSIACVVVSSLILLRVIDREVGLTIASWILVLGLAIEGILSFAFARSPR